MEGPLYGLNIAMYISYVRILTKDSSNVQKRFLLAIATLQLILATGHYITTLIDLSDGFLTHATDLGGSDLYFADAAHPHYIAELFFYFTNYVIGDALMGWRCYVVWQHNPAIAILFATMVVGSMISGYSTIGHIANLTSTQDLFDVRNWTTAIFTISLGIQVTATTLIVWKILRSSSGVGGALAGRGEYLSVIWMIVESGAVLTASSATVLTLYLLSMNAGAIMSPIITQMSFLIPMSIIVRARMKRNARTANAIPLHGYNHNNVTLGSHPRSTGMTTIQTSVGANTTVVATSIDTKVDMDSVTSTVATHV